MADDKQLEALESEFKLIKGELKQTLASVRDYLVTSEIPASEYATIMAAIGGGGGQTMQMKGSFAMPRKPELQEEMEEEPEEEELVGELPPEKDTVGKSAPGEELIDELLPGEELVEPEESFMTESGLTEPQEELEKFKQEELEEYKQEELEKFKAEVSQSVPRVNLLANLIRWVAKAKREIGSERLPAFLEVYGISGHLSLELKEVIMNLADITSEQPAEANAADVWSQSLLELHGVLAGGDAPFHPVKPFWQDDGGGMQLDETETKAEAEPGTDGVKDKLVKLKLVFSSGDGLEKEFSVNLNSENGQENS